MVQQPLKGFYRPVRLFFNTPIKFYSELIYF